MYVLKWSVGSTSWNYAICGPTMDTTSVWIPTTIVVESCSVPRKIEKIRLKASLMMFTDSLHIYNLSWTLFCKRCRDGGFSLFFLISFDMLSNYTGDLLFNTLRNITIKQQNRGLVCICTEWSGIENSFTLLYSMKSIFYTWHECNVISVRIYVDSVNTNSIERSWFLLIKQKVWHKNIGRTNSCFTKERHQEIKFKTFMEKNQNTSYDHTLGLWPSKLQLSIL